ncbi:MAG: peptidoglycan DD-metalloendopeptidase family protein [Magnetococcales bacterium]|nr:peptidoglycan DD-metalloendopeptidase family protein [Magnetococcales bacterium]
MSASPVTGLKPATRGRPKPTTPWMALCFGLAVAIGGWPGGLFAASEKPVQKTSHKVNQIIKNLGEETKALQKQQGLEQGILTDLEVLDKELTDLVDRREEQTRQLQQANAELPELAKQIVWHQEQLGKIRSSLAHSLRLMYGLGSQGILRIIFSQESAAGVRQGVLYYGRLVQARNEQFHSYREHLAELRQASANYQMVLTTAQGLVEAMAEELVHLEQRKAERTRLLASIRDKKALHQQKIEELQKAGETLTGFVDKLNRALPAVAVVPEEQGPGHAPAKSAGTSTTSSVGDEDRNADQTFEHIVKRKGRLPPPVKGRHGQSRPPGLFYPANSDTPVKAVYHGQVVYADWFRGYGLLVILNHGDHIYSLYGYNQKLLVAAGDWVEAQETIAVSGSTGSTEGSSGLYFEMRDNGQSVNPRLWLGS